MCEALINIALFYYSADTKWKVAVIRHDMRVIIYEVCVCVCVGGGDCNMNKLGDLCNF